MPQRTRTLDQSLPHDSAGPRSVPDSAVGSVADMRLPRRLTLADQTYRLLLNEIQEGRWNSLLPGERTLCEQLRISRLTLRQALRQLEENGILDVQQGRRRAVSATARKAAPAAKAKRRVVGYLCPTQALDLPGYTSRSMAAIEHTLHRHDFAFRIVCRPGCYTDKPTKALERVVNEIRADCWIVLQSTESMQRWFETRQVPALLSGTAFPGIRLPFVDLDNAAVCRHAVGRLAAAGCASLCYFAEDTIGAGDTRSEEGFLSGLRATRGLSGRVVRTEGTPEAVRRKIEALLERSNRPDGLLVDRSNHMYTVMGAIQLAGLRIPHDTSLICRTESIDFPFTVPAVTHYSRNIREVARRTAELAMKLARREPVDQVTTLLFPDFIPGQSVRQV